MDGTNEGIFSWFTVNFLLGQLSKTNQAAALDLDDDVFGIDELTIFKGEWKENIYTVSGDVLDDYLYDLLMNLLEEKGISSEFVEKMADLATAYEHSSYIALLENLSKFTTGNVEEKGSKPKRDVKYLTA
ncbi:complement component 1 Q subcomponent-binding protein, mitochondrial-like [Glossina fuscipes fuscipes]